MKNVQHLDKTQQQMREALLELLDHVDSGRVNSLALAYEAGQYVHEGWTREASDVPPMLGMLAILQARVLSFL